MKLNQLLNEGKNTLWIVMYFYRTDQGRPASGSYLVNAPSKKSAIQIIQNMNLGYSRMKAITVSQAADEYSMEIDDFLDGLRVPTPGQAEHIESGT